MNLSPPDGLPAASDSEPAHEINARGLRCPLPVLRMEAVLRRLAPGERLRIVADDPIAAVDIPFFAHEGGHGCVRITPVEGSGAGICVFLVTRGENQ